MDNSQVFSLNWNRVLINFETTISVSHHVVISDYHVVISDYHVVISDYIVLPASAVSKLIRFPHEVLLIGCHQLEEGQLGPQWAVSVGVMETP